MLENPYPLPRCMVCDAEVGFAITAYALDETGEKRRVIETAAPCGHVQLDTILDVADGTIGQIMAASAADTIRFTRNLLTGSAPGSVTAALGVLADLVEHYTGADKCPLCGGNDDDHSHDPRCELRFLTEEMADASA